MTKEISIKLRDGNEIIIDEVDLPLVEQYAWRASPKNYVTCAYVKSKDGAKRSVSSRILHRMITNAPIGSQVDHINGNKLDNRRSNLRVVTASQNMCNLPPKKHLKYKGIYTERNGNFTARIQFQGKRYHVGTFKQQIEAVKAYNEKAKEIHGEFAWLNKI